MKEAMLTVQHVEYEDPELWNNARECLRSIGGLPLFLTSTVRAVRNARVLFNDENSEAFKDAISQTIRRLLLSPSYKAAFLEAAREYHADKLSELGSVSAREVSMVFTADETAAIILNYYLFRRLRALTSQEDFGPLIPRIRTSIALGHLVGQLIEPFESGHGMVIGASQVFALVVLCKNQPQVFREYRRKMRTRRELFNASLEVEYFRTTARHVAAALIQACGFGPSPALGMYLPNLSNRAIDDTVQLWSKVRRIVEILQLRGAAVTHEELSALQVVQQAKFNQLLERVGEVCQNMELSNWLFVGKEQGLELLGDSDSLSKPNSHEEALS